MALFSFPVQDVHSIRFFHQEAVAVADAGLEQHSDGVRQSVWGEARTDPMRVAPAAHTAFFNCNLTFLRNCTFLGAGRMRASGA